VSPGPDAVIVVRAFDASEADLGTGAEGGNEKLVEAAKEMQANAPEILAEAMVKELKALEYFAGVLLDSGNAPAENTILLEGRFTVLNPGSRTKRYFVGFGAGKEQFEIEGVIKSPAGAILIEFRHDRGAVMGVAGGDYQKKMAAGMEHFGKDIAAFLYAWSRGEL
jgi:hypothetical protein